MEVKILAGKTFSVPLTPWTVDIQMVTPNFGLYYEREIVGNFLVYSFGLYFLTLLVEKRIKKE